MRIKREAAWLTGCCAMATAVCWFAPEYEFSPVPFLTAVFYVVSGVVRSPFG